MPNKRSDNVPSNNLSRNGRGSGCVAALVVMGACVNVCMGAACLIYSIGKIL